MFACLISVGVMTVNCATCSLGIGRRTRSCYRKSGWSQNIQKAAGTSESASDDQSDSSRLYYSVWKMRWKVAMCLFSFMWTPGGTVAPRLSFTKQLLVCIDSLYTTCCDRCRINQHVCAVIFVGSSLKSENV